MPQSIFAIGHVIMSFLMASQAFAYGPCDDDEAKFCDSKTHQQTVKECLHKRLDELSQECRDFVKSKEESWSKVRSSWDQVRSTCEADIKKHCKDLDKEVHEMMKAVQVCLMSEGKNLAVSCKKDLNRHIREHQPNIRELP